MEKIKKYEEQSKRYIIYILISTIVFLLCTFVAIRIIDINSMNSLPILRDLNSINIIIGIMAIPCCLLYYHMYGNNEFFILTLSYVSIFIDYIYVNYIFESVGLSQYLINFPFVFRIFLLTIAIFNENKHINKIVERKSLSIILVLIINIIGTYLEIKLNLSIFFNEKNTLVWNIFQINILIYYAILLALLAIRCMKKREIIYIIFVTTISIFTVRRVFYFSIFEDCNNKIIEYNKVLTFIAYLILFIGVYIEIVRRIEESIRLNSQVSDFKKLKIKYKEMKEVEKAKGQFFANLSHEIKTPINIIYSCVQLLDINKKEGEKELWNSYNKYDNTIKQNCYRLLRLVNNLVDMTKIDSGYMNLNFVNYDIVSLVENIVISIIPYVESKNINVLFDTYIEELEIRCDPESIERVILNLLSNAIKFTNNNGNIFVLMDSDDDYVTIRVKDDGVGVSAEVQEEIFKRFVQEDKSFNRKKEGSGIGLALTKSLVELHNGQVYLEKGTEKGSEFVVKLPNVRDGDKKENDNKIIDVDNKPLVQKIHIEFSDIYELY